MLSDHLMNEPDTIVFETLAHCTEQPFSVSYGGSETDLVP